MKATIYMVTMTSYTASDNNLYNNTWTYDNEEEARQQYVSLRDEQSEECRWGADYDNDDHTDDCEYTFSEREDEDGNTYEASSEAYEGYRVQIRLEKRTIEIAPATDETDGTDTDSDSGDEQPVKMAIIRVRFSDQEQFARACQLYGSEGESIFWAGDWDREQMWIEFAEAGEVEDVEQTIRADLEHYGLTAYETEGETEWA